MIFDISKNILAFIGKFTGNGQRQEVIDTFECGCCYWFARILIKRFSGLLMYDDTENHFGAEISGRIYDVTGDVTDKYDWTAWTRSDANADPFHRDRIFKSCVLMEDEENE